MPPTLPPLVDGAVVYARLPARFDAAGVDARLECRGGEVLVTLYRFGEPATVTAHLVVDERPTTTVDVRL